MKYLFVHKWHFDRDIFVKTILSIFFYLLFINVFEIEFKKIDILIILSLSTFFYTRRLSKRLRFEISEVEFFSNGDIKIFFAHTQKDLLRVNISLLKVSVEGDVVTFIYKEREQLIGYAYKNCINEGSDWSSFLKDLSVSSAQPIDLSITQK